MSHQEDTTGPKSRGLRRRLVGVLLLVSLLPLGLVGLGSWVVFGRLLESKSLELHRTLVRGHASAIDLYLAERLRALDLAAASHSLDDLSQPEILQELFEKLNKSYDRAFVDLGVINGEGQHLAYVGPYDLMGRNYSQTDWFRYVMTQGSYVSDVFLGFRRVPHLVMAVKGQQGPHWWILRATINSDQFASLVRTGEPSQTGDTYIVNAQGLYQTPPRVGKLLEPSPLSSPEVHSGVKESRTANGSATLVQATTWINSGRWMLVVQQDESEIKAPVFRAMAWGTLVASLAMALLFITTILATRILTRQIDRANEQREELSKALMRSARLASLGELATGLAHEINNPLAIISAEQTNISDLVSLGLDEPSQAEVLESVERCKRQVVRCRNITSKMLQFGRKSETRLMRTDIAPLVEEVAQLMGKQALVRNVELKVQLEPDLPLLVVDSTELQQVLVNLLTNAMDAIEGQGEVVIKALRVGEEVQIWVSDSGSGIASEHIERIFQPFFTTKAVGKGTGLGLSVCHGLVTSWGGTIEAQSQIGAGSQMIIHLPLSITPGTKNAGERHGTDERKYQATVG